MSRIGVLALVVVLAGLVEGAEKECNKECSFGGICELINGKPRCDCSRDCPMIYQPVCGSDGESYVNKCDLEVNRCDQQNDIRVVHEGECKPGQKPGQPTKLCDSVNCKFGGKCKLVNGKPKCACNDLCPALLRPVCGSDGKTYPNSCVLENARCKEQKDIRLVHEGECKPGQPTNLCNSMKCDFGAKCVERGKKAQCVCDEKCPAKVEPVCGSDGESYTNECALKLANCVKKSRVKVAHKGACGARKRECNKKCSFGARCELTKGGPKCVCDRDCKELFDPVCGSDGKTYDDWCELEVARCTKQKEIRRVHKGNCKPKPCDKPCKSEYKPVCGSDNVTYSSECELNRLNCIEDMNIWKVHSGKCGFDCKNIKCDYGSECTDTGEEFECLCNMRCHERRFPVCGSNGKTYLNLCKLKKENCEKETRIKVVRRGDCIRSSGGIRPPRPRPFPGSFLPW